MTLFDEVGDIPTPPAQIDPGGTALPPGSPALPATPASPATPEIRETGETGETGGESTPGPDRPSTAVGADFQPGTGVWPPSGPKARARANIEAITVVAALEATDRPATAAEQETLARWSGWGTLPHIFEAHREEWAEERAALRQAVTEEQYQQAAATTLNAHYTDPGVVGEVWNFLEESGFTGGRVLEPGSGVGSFIGLAPGSASMVGVELDSMTARISAALYPSAQVRNEGFETTRVPENSFVATVGNVPFGRYALHDPAHNPNSHSIHNHFILKSLALTAPGGYVAVLTSRYTMDAGNDRARREMAATADLVGAVRLPTGAFSRVAGTAVLTDLIVLRKRAENEPAQADQGWLAVAPVAATAEDGQAVEVEVNAYYATHPDNVLGALRTGHGMYNADTLMVEGPHDAELAEQLRDRLVGIRGDAATAGLTLDVRAGDTTTVAEALFDPGLVTAATAARAPMLDTLTYDEESGGLRRWAGQQWVAHPVGKAKLAEFRELLALRDTTTALIGAHAAEIPVGQRDQLRGELNRLYDRYVTVHGPINRFRWTQPHDITQGKHDERMGKFEATWRDREGFEGVPYPGPVPDSIIEGWEERAWTPTAPSKRYAHLDGGIRDDPGFATVAMLEHFDEETQTARKATIFATDVLSARVPRTSAANAEEAVAISMDETGTLDVDRIAALLGLDPAAAREALVGSVFADPTDPTRLVTAARYLSGNVRTKLAAAEAAAEYDPTYDANVAALAEVLPRTVEASEIELRPGAPWIDPTDYEAFVREVLQAPSAAVDFAAGTWTVEVSGWNRRSPVMTEVYGTGSYDAAKLLEAVCNSRPIQVLRPKKEVAERGGDPVDMEETFAAQAQARKLTEKFREWVWTDEDRRNRLVTEYNTRFNSLRPARYDGSALALPGQSGRTPHPHQRDAVARIIAEPTVLLDHVVGAGKTGVMVMGAMELRRLGLARQPWIVVPNHLVEQVGREAKQWYPAANILIGSNTTNLERRQRFAAQTAVGDWDAVIVPKSVFTAIGVSPQRRVDYQQKSLDDLRAAKLAARTPLGAKKIEAAVKAQEKRIKDLTETPTKDTGLTFEQVGADYLLMDEAHMTKI